MRKAPWFRWGRGSGRNVDLNKRRGILLLPIFALAAALPGPASSEDFASKIKKPVEKGIAVRLATQEKEDKWAREREKRISELSMLETENRMLMDKRDALLSEAGKKRETVAELERKRSELSKIAREMQPFLESLCRRMAGIVESGYPFQREERRQKVGELLSVVEDPGTGISEKFRRVMEGLFAEAGYGNGIEVYSRRIEVEESEITASVLRLGRVALFFLSPDGKRSGFYDMAEGAYKFLPEAFNSRIAGAVAMGEKRRTAEILELPLGRIGK